MFGVVKLLKMQASRVRAFYSHLLSDHGQTLSAGQTPDCDGRGYAGVCLILAHTVIWSFDQASIALITIRYLHLDRYNRFDCSYHYWMSSFTQRPTKVKLPETGACFPVSSISRTMVKLLDSK